jgi:hypothetical protein
MNTATDPRKKAAQLAAMQQRSRDTVAAEVERIIRVPMKQTPTEEFIDNINWYYLKPEAYASGFRLLPAQVEALIAYNEQRGGFMDIAVGGGKTYSSLLIGNDCYTRILEKKYKEKGTGAAEDIQPRPLLLIPSYVLQQLRDRDISEARRLTRFSCPVHFLSGVSKQKRLAIARTQRRGLYVMTYSIMSSEDADEILELVNPPCIIGDEGHLLAGQNSARGKRFRRYVDKHGPEVVVMSGTITNKTPMDYHYMAKASLGQNNFLPNSTTLAQAWSMIIDSNASTLYDSQGGQVPQAGPIKPLVDWCREHFPEEEFNGDLLSFRKAYNRRLHSTPGVVSTSGNDYGGSLLIENREIPKHKMEATEGYDKMRDLLDQLTTRWVSPNGDELEHAMHIWKWRYEIEGAGFYNDLYWPEPEVLGKRKGLSIRDATDVVKRSVESHNLQQAYAKELRSFLKDNSRTGMDTPKQVGRDMYRHQDANVPAAMYLAWDLWKKSDFEGRIDRDSRAVRVCPYKINACVDYVKKQRKHAKGGGLVVWYYHQAVGAWITEALREAGVDAVNCMAGPNWNSYLVDSEKLKGKVLCCSINAHGTGKNLQYGFDTCYYLQWPRAAKIAAQSIGRFHRKGQDSDLVRAVTCNSTEFDRITMAATLNDAAYVSQTLGKRNLMYATYNPPPKQVPFTVLQEWGTQAKTLGVEGKRLLSGLAEA